MKTLKEEMNLIADRMKTAMSNPIINLEGPDFSWYKEATNEMIYLVKKEGQQVYDVINKMSKLYSEKHKAYSQHNQYDSFDFANDALWRRAWEMGLTEDAHKEELEMNFMRADSTDNWFDSATQRMIDYCNAGHHYMLVINALSREYASYHDDIYDAFDFASDALGRRCWELGYCH